MKKIVKYVFLMLLLLPVLVSASDYSTSWNKAGDLLHNKYTAYNYEDFLYPNNASFLKREEYEISLKNNKNTTSYLAFGERYWVLKENDDSNYYYIGGIQENKIEKNKKVILGLGVADGSGSNLSTRATEMVLPETTVTETGTMSDPWVFVTKYKLELEYEQDKVEKVSVNGTEISNSDIKCSKGICVAYAGRYKAECDSETKECTANVELKLKAPNIYVSNNCGGILQDNGIIKISKLIRNTKCNLKLGSGKYKVELSNDFGTSRATTLVDPNPIYLYYGENFYTDNTFKTPIYTLKTKPALNGYVFKGYRTIGGTKIIDETGKIVNKTAITEDNTKLVIDYEMDTVKVTFDLNAGGATDARLIGTSPQEFTFGSKYTGMPSADWKGHKFEGWFTSKSGGTNVTENTTATKTGNITLYAHWTLKDITLTFNANGGKYSNNSNEYKITQKYGTSVTSPANPTKDGHYIENANDNSKKYDKPIPTTMPAEDMTLTIVKWIPYTVSINYQIQDDESLKPQTKNSDETETYNWTKNTDRLILLNSSLLKQTINYGGQMGKYGLTNYNNKNYLKITKEGYTAKSGEEWKCASGCTVANKTFNQDTKYNASDFCNATNGNCTVKLKVNWQANKFTVAYNANGGTGTTASHECTYNANCNLASNGFTKTGHTFAGWKKANTGDTLSAGASIKNAATSGTVTYYAQWAPKTITVTYMANTSSSDTTSVSQTFTYGVSGNRFGYNTNGDPTWAQTGQFGGWDRSGYSLLGWSTDRNATAATYNTYSWVADEWLNNNSPSITLYAIWESKTLYTCSYLIRSDDGEGACCKTGKGGYWGDNVWKDNTGAGYWCYVQNLTEERKKAVESNGWGNCFVQSGVVQGNCVNYRH